MSPCDFRKAWLAFLLFSLSPEAGFCFNWIGTDPGSKWDDPNWGTGAVITWSFMTPGVGLGPGTPSHWVGTNTLGTGNAQTDIRVVIDDRFGNGAFDAAVRRALDAWSAATNVTFQQVPDPGGAMGTATFPDIRIGAFDFGEFAPGQPDLAGGAGFGPPGNDLQFPDALAGDLALNNANRFTIATGHEGDPLPTGPNGEYLNDIEGLLLHEIGHTLGLAHSDVIDALMCGYIYPGDVFDGSACLDTVVHHALHADDLGGITALYGPAAPAMPNTVTVPTIPLIGQILLAGLLARIGLQSNRSLRRSPVERAPGSARA